MTSPPIRFSHSSYDSGAGPNPNNNPICGKSITAKGTFPRNESPLFVLNVLFSCVVGGKTVKVKVADKCRACAKDDIDLSPAAFDQLADSAVGRLHNVTWSLS